MTEQTITPTDRGNLVGELKQLVRQILDVSHPPYSLGPEVASLRRILSEEGSFRIDAGRDIGDGETRLDSGLAVSPTQAAMCAEEVARTPVFIRGVHEAIQYQRKSLASKGKTHVLYAGCGPYALLAIPQMALFSSEELSFTLLDLHGDSLSSAKSLVNALGFSDHVIRYEERDATTYEIPTDETPDIIVSETMNVCLSNEPQVTIVRHLLRQAPEAIMVPQQVRVSACLVDMTREFNFSEAGKEESETPKLDRDRVELGPIFELSSETIQDWASLNGDRLPAALVEIPDPLDPRYQVMLLTRIRTFGENCLGDYDCSLTIPMQIPVRDPIVGGESFHFHYRLGKNPRLECKILESSEVADSSFFPSL